MCAILSPTMVNKSCRIFYDCACTPFITLNRGNGGHQFVNGINNPQWRVLNEKQDIVEKNIWRESLFCWEIPTINDWCLWFIICHSINHVYQTYNLDVYLAIVYSIIFFRHAVPNLSFYFHQITCRLVCKLIGPDCKYTFRKSALDVSVFIIYYYHYHSYITYSKIINDIVKHSL